MDTTPKPFVFVLMPFDEEFEDIYKLGIKEAAKKAGAYAERLDEQMYKEGILERIFNQISKADVIVADMTGRNPNVFYEVGYAHALGKLVLLVTQKTDDIPFDLKHQHHIVYEGKITKLLPELVKKIRWAVEQSKSGATAAPPLELWFGKHRIPLVGTGRVPVIKFKSLGDDRFTTAFAVKNNSVEVSPAITHVYLFASQESDLVPCKKERSFDGDPDPLVPVYWDEKEHQYRLDARIPSMPAGAVEEMQVVFGVQKRVYSVNVRFRLRLHSAAHSSDYAFRMKVEFDKKQMEERRKEREASRSSVGSITYGSIGD